MKIAVVGCGAMGSVYAGLLASAGHAVVVVDRWQEHVEAIRRNGLRVEGASGDRIVHLTAREDAPREAMDLVIVATKAAQTAQAAQDARAMLGKETVVLTIQNGLGSADVVADAVGSDRLLVGVAAAFGASLRGPGHARHEGMAAIRMGPYAGPEAAQGDATATVQRDSLAKGQSDLVASVQFDAIAAARAESIAAARVGAIAAVWREAGFTAEAVRDVLVMQWEKLICNVAYSAPCALTGMTVGQVMGDAEIGPVSRAAAVEALKVARARGVAVTVDDAVAHVRAFGARIPDARPSVLLDHEKRRQSEIDVINGAIPREAARCGLEAPVNATLAALVKQRERAF